MSRVVHEPAGGEPEDRIVLATEVEWAESLLAKARGVMFRSELPAEFALVMEMGTGLFGGPKRQGVHTLFVRVPIDVIWLVDDEVTAVKTLQPWRGIGTARADRIIELPAGGANGVTPGDRVFVEESSSASPNSI